MMGAKPGTKGGVACLKRGSHAVHVARVHEASGRTGHHKARAPLHGPHHGALGSLRLASVREVAAELAWRAHRV
jgi:hypothetical protein